MVFKCSWRRKREDINKIEFASGRIEFINPDGAEDKSEEGIGLQSHHNLVAVLPFAYISNVTERMSGQMSTKVQADCISALKAKSKEFTFQDAVTTNALLAKHEISDANIKSFTPDEIALAVVMQVADDMKIDASDAACVYATKLSAQNARTKPKHSHFGEPRAEITSLV